MASTEREPIWGSGGFAPSGVQGRSPWSGGRSPPEAEGIFMLRYGIFTLRMLYDL